MAGSGFRTFTAGAVLTAAQVQNYLQDQAVMVFASAAARTTALASPAQGMVSFLNDSNSYWQYYEAYNSGTNPGGASVAGWYPAEGTVLFAGKRTNTSVSIANITFTVTSFNTFQCAGSTSNTTTIQINSATVPSTFTVRQAGWYQISGTAKSSSWSSTAGTTRQIVITRNSASVGSSAIAKDIKSSPADASEVASVNVTVLLAAGDVIRIFLYQDSGGSATNSDHNFSITYLRPASV